MIHPGSTFALRGGSRRACGDGRPIHLPRLARVEFVSDIMTLRPWRGLVKPIEALLHDSVQDCGKTRRQTLGLIYIYM